MKRKVLITAGGSEIAIPIIRSLINMNKDLELIITETNSLSAGNFYGHKAYIVPSAAHKDYSDAIIDICKKEKIDIVLAGSDSELLKLSEIKEKKYVDSKILVSSSKVIHICRNKKNTYEFFKEKQLPFAATVLYEDINELIEQKGFPIIAKKIDGSGSIGVKALFSIDDFIKLQHKDTYIFQEYLTEKDKSKICKDDILSDQFIKQKEEVSAQVFVGHNKEILGLCMTENQLKFGMPVKIVPFHDKKVEQSILKIAKELIALGLIGPCNFQGKRTSDGFEFFEINARFTGMSGVREKMGYKEHSVAIEHFLYNLSEEECKKNLSLDLDKIACRHYDEVIGAKERLFQLEKNKYSEIV